MSQISVFDMTGKKVADTELNDAIFGIEPNKAIMHAMVVNYLANQRQGTQSALTRSEVSGGGRKPFAEPVVPERGRTILPDDSAYPVAALEIQGKSRQTRSMGGAGPLLLRRRLPHGASGT